MTLYPSAISRHLTITIPGTVATDGGPNGDGYYFGAAADGFTFGNGVTIVGSAIQAQDAPSGEDLILTIHNITDVTSDTITLADGSAFDEDDTIDLDVGASDLMAIQVTQDGGAATPENAAGWLTVVLEYTMQ